MKVSVIIPNHNRASLVAETVDNMLLQSLSPHEIIVIDDGSTDDSVKVLKSFGDKITLIVQDNQGPGAARNAGLKIASGDFIQFMDSDDLVSLNKLEAQVKLLISQDADIVYSPWVKVYFKEKKINLENVVLQQAPVPNNQSMVTYFLTGWSIVFQQCLFRSSFIKKAGFYRTDMWTGEDSEFFLRMLLLEPKIIFSNAVLTLYRLNDYGKLTGDGATRLDRVRDWARFLIASAAMCNASKKYKLAHMNPAFLTNVWKTCQILKSLNSSETDLINSLDSLLQRFRGLPFWALRSRTTEVAKGLQYRIKGHRWPHSYQTGPLMPQQQRLIEELGFYIA